MGTDLLVYIASVATGHRGKASFRLNATPAGATTKDPTGAFTEILTIIEILGTLNRSLAVRGDMGQFYDAITNGTKLTSNLQHKQPGILPYRFQHTWSMEISAENGEVVACSVYFRDSGVLASTPHA